jgi:hypothetical protein
MVTPAVIRLAASHGRRVPPESSFLLTAGIGSGPVSLP